MQEAAATGLPVIYNFVGTWPLLMTVIWTLGGLMFYLTHELGKPGFDTLPMDAEYPSVSILVPCFNEEEGIEETLRACMAQVFDDYEVIAINDGSTDGTATILDRLALEFPTLRVVHLARNQGKAMALRTGAMVSRGDVLVCIDGDGIIHPHCVAWLVCRFTKFPRLGAVTGNPRIRNRSSLLGLLQVGEFSATVGLIKRTQRLDGRLFTVSGAITAFRKAALRDVGWWSPDNLTEDVDVTWKLNRRFWTIHFEPNALCYILMPETVRGLWRQRLRWATGGAQTFLRYSTDFLQWRGRRMWGVLIEYMISLTWCYAMLITLALTLLGLADLLPEPLGPPPPLIWIWGMILSIASLFQFFCSLWIDRKAERDAGVRYLPMFWVIWYPMAFWALAAAAAVIGFPRALLYDRGRRARWVSPDRGFR